MLGAVEVGEDLVNSEVEGGVRRPFFIGQDLETLCGWWPEGVGAEEARATQFLSRRTVETAGVRRFPCRDTAGRERRERTAEAEMGPTREGADPGGAGGDPSSGSGLGGGKGGSLLYEDYRMDGSTYPAVLSGGYGFSSGDIGEDAQYLGPVDGGLSGGGGGGYGAGGGGYSGSGYTGGGGGGGAGGSYNLAADGAFSPFGGVGGGGQLEGGNGGNGALVGGTFAVNAGDQLSIYVGGGGESLGSSGGNGWVTLSVPEPGSANLLLLGLAAVLARARRFRR